MNTLNKAALGRYRGLRIRKLTPAQMDSLEKARREFERTRKEIR